MADQLPDKIMALLACPACKHGLAQEENHLSCTHSECRRRYPIRNKIPILLLSEADRPGPTPASPGKRMDP